MESETNSESSSDSLFTIARGATIFATGKIVYNILEFLLNIVLTRTVGASLYGVYAYATTILSAMLVLTNGGTDKSVLKYLPQYEEQPQIRDFMLGLAFLTSIIGGFSATIVLVISAPVISRVTLDSTVFINTLRIFAVIILFDTVAKIINSTFRAVELLEYEVFVDRMVKPALRLGAVVVALYLSFSFIAVMASLLAASILAFLTSVWLLLTRLEIKPSIQGPEASIDNARSYYNYSLPLIAKDGASVLRSRVDILMVGLFLSSTIVGIYNVAILISSLLVLPLAAFNQLFPPIVSKLYSNDKISELNTIFSTITRWTFSITLFLGLAVIAYRIRILTLFGPEFVAGSTVLVLFIIGQIVNNATGPSAYVLMMTDHQYVVLVNQWIFGVLNVILNYVFISEFGLIGAAVATAGTLGILNIIRVAEVWYFERLFPYTFAFFKPVIAGGVAFGAMYGIEGIVSNQFTLIIGGILGGLIYIGVLFGLGMEKDDKEFLSEITS